VGIIIECPGRILPLEAGYIYADCPSPTSNLMRSGGGPYIFANYSDHLVSDPSVWLSTPFRMQQFVVKYSTSSSWGVR
jgi:hypothetical protein